jgi:hypothetical protein
MDAARNNDSNLELERHFDFVDKNKAGTSIRRPLFSRVQVLLRSDLTRRVVSQAF